MTLAVMSILALSFFVPGAAVAGVGEDIQQGVDSAAGGNNNNPEGSLQNTISNIITIFSILVGVVAVIMIIIGGFRYITSGGDPQRVTSAKNTLLYAIIGLIIVALAQIIVKFVLTETNQAASGTGGSSGGSTNPPGRRGGI